MAHSKGSSEEIHPLFPSGDWEGFYKYPYAYLPPDPMHCFLNFRQGTVTGSGSDSVGAFSWKGSYDTEALTCQLTKYYTTHTVFYKGQVDENGIWGHWRINDFSKGGFHIWPKKGGEEEEGTENEEVEEEIEELETFAFGTFPRK